MPSTDSLGIRNKNYLNVKNGTSPWMDASGEESHTDARGHAVFTDPAYGVRAGILLLRTYFFKHNLRTIAEILARWAPAEDTIGSLPGAPHNSPREYATFVAGRMGISYNEPLDLFNADRSVGNIARLRALFCAMAEYEIGQGFQVPVEEFHAGLELVEPGIRSDGTSTESTGPLQTASSSAAASTGQWQISGAVGRWDKGAVNAEPDIETIQQMLRIAAMVLQEPRIDPGGIDGKIGKDAQTSATVKTIVAFQSRFLTAPDGVIAVGGRTWRELVGVLDGSAEDAQPPPEPQGTPKCFFPFDHLPKENWTDAPRSFAAVRDRGRRAHAGCDLYAPVGTIIYAITDGTVVRGPSPFYAGTYSMEIDHSTFLARYGEVQESAFVRTGDRVKAGQPIAKVGRLVGIAVPSAMLHLELYNKSQHGPLTVSAAESLKTADGRPFRRRRDLIDPTPKLNVWQTNLPGSLRAPHHMAGTPTGAIPTTGFCIHLKRIRQEQRSTVSYPRTVGEYQCYWAGIALDHLRGQMVERGGPGDNTTAVGDNRDRRLREGLYRLAIQDGPRYKTYRYDSSDTSPSGQPKPGLLLQDTDERSAILIHPGQDYLSSIGCLNPALGLTDANSRIDFTDSRNRAIAIIDALKAKLGVQCPRSGTIPEATIFIEGEPM